jgi:hypothetical protein
MGAITVADLGVPNFPALVGEDWSQIVGAAADELRVDPAALASSIKIPGAMYLDKIGPAIAAVEGVLDGSLDAADIDKISVALGLAAGTIIATAAGVGAAAGPIGAAAGIVIGGVAGAVWEATFGAK